MTLEMGKAVVETSCGRLCGTVQKSIEGYDYYAFKGVPYAKPPVGELRFQVSDGLEQLTIVNHSKKCAQ